MIVKKTDLGRYGFAVPGAPARKGLGAFGGEWEDWCTTAYADQDLVNACQHWGPAPPWTDVGRIWRGIPRSDAEVAELAQKEIELEEQRKAQEAADLVVEMAARQNDEWGQWCLNGGAENEYAGEMRICLKDVGGLGAPWTPGGKFLRWMSASFEVKPEEFDPENYAITMNRDHVRGIYLWALWNSIPPGVRTARGISEIPLSMPSIIESMIQAIPVSYERGGWERVWEKLVAPFAVHSLDGLLDLCNHGFGPMFFVVRGLKNECKSNRYSPQTQAIICAMVDWTNLLEVLTHPQTLKESSTIATLGNVIWKISAQIDEGGLRDVLFGFGRALELNAVAISIFANDPTPDGALKALDNFFERVTGISLLNFRKTIANFAGSTQEAYGHLVRNGSAHIDEESLQSVTIMSSALDSVGKALGSVNLNSLGKIFVDFKDFLDKLLGGEIKDLDDVAHQLVRDGAPMTPAPSQQEVFDRDAGIVPPVQLLVPQADPEVPPFVPSTFLNTSPSSATVTSRRSMNITQSVFAPSTQTVDELGNVIPPAGPVAAPSGGVLGAALVGALPGLLVGGPVGGAIGAGVGIALAAMKK